MAQPSINYKGNDWGVLEDWLKVELSDTYKRLAVLTMKEEETQQMRGRISLLTMMLDFPNDMPPYTRAAI